MQTIYKYPLGFLDTQEVPLPKGATVLSAQVQNGVICLWALCNTDAPIAPRTIYTVGTGHNFNMDPSVIRFIGTVQLSGGALVFHLFEYIGF